MPIRDDLKPLYPHNWQEIRQRILERARDRCEHCGVHNDYWGYRDSAGEFHPAPWAGAGAMWSDHRAYLRGAISGGYKEFRIVLTIAHLDHDPTNNADENLAALCCQCHNRHDGMHRARNRSKTRDRARGQARFWDDP